MSLSSSARSALVNNEVFLGGQFIEVGVRNTGSYGASGSKPGSFYGNPSTSNLGLTSDADGFGVGLDLRLDYFIPGTPSEGYAWGYTLSGSASGSNYSNTGLGSQNITSLVNTDLSGDPSIGYDLAAKTSYYVTSGGSNVLEVESIIYFNEDWSYFWTEVSAKNVSESTLADVRFIRAFDPDNDVFYSGGGEFATNNEITAIYEIDGYSAVQAKSTGDAYIADSGKPANILFYSEDALSRTSIGSADFGVTNAYAPDLYDNAADGGGRQLTGDTGISIGKQISTLGVGQTFTFKYLTSLGALTAADIRDSVASGTEQPKQESVDGAVVNQGVVNAFGNGVAAPTERQVTSDGSQNDSISGGPSLTLIDVEYTNVPGSTVYGQFSNGLSGYIGGSSELLSSAELIDLSRWSQSYKDLDAGRAHQSFVMNTQSTVQLLNELGAGNAIRYLYAGDFEVNGGDGTPKTFSISNTPTDGVTDVLNISRPGTEQFVLDLKGFTGMAITGPGVDVIGSDENNYVITDGAGTLEMGNGKDVIVMNNMNGVVDGGNDLDVARVFGNSFSVSVVENGGILYVTNGLGTTLFTSVEVLVLDNGYYKKDIASGGWQWVDQVAKELDAVSLIGVQGTGVDL